MAMDNPAFRNSAFQQGGQVATASTQQGLSAEELVQMYNRPAAAPTQTDRMTVEDTIAKTGISFGVLLVAAVVGWQFPALAIPAAIVGFVLALVNIFKKEPSPGLILAYAGAQGLFVGGISGIFEAQWAGIVTQAVIATLVVVGVTLALFASGKIRASKRATKIFLVAMIGYAVFSLVNVGMMFFGATDSAFGLRSDIEIMGIPLGIILGIFVVLMAAYSLVLDFDMIQQGVRNRAPRKYGWTGAFGIMVTVVWLYLELLRMFAIARD
ncbi:Bax inhibitor-1/YccA family protein [Labedella endophytica]|jgi:uncharacterized YccA/Bax inhibitor family protein|uniref:Bax inhibitor-1/YccA family protein n=1 Tax=Labedella endophytica TaxID=1523160 RepID=A0A3S0V968_9MICO|nr:Bax inhibitor-1/YccA family protein [Labedella endophytica]RUQ98944.1 Bax inhibitor-1/YccA family protein [Labedella endophytica]